MHTGAKMSTQRPTLLVKLYIPILNVYHPIKFYLPYKKAGSHKMSRDMSFPTMWYVRLRSEPMLVARI